MITLLSADEWIEKYQPEMENGAIKMYETFGEEFATVKASEPRKVWTLIAEENDVFIESGYRWVNRLCYLITEVPWEEGRYWDNAIIVNWGVFEND
jgi:hypothetical protein